MAKFDLSDILEHPIAFRREFVDLTGSVNAALFLSQAIYWQKRVPEAGDGWWYKSQAEWTLETGLSGREQATVRKRLRELGILDERRGLQSLMWFRIDLSKFSEKALHPIAFRREFVDLTGSVNAALFLSQAIYWQKRIPEASDGWWYKSQAEWTLETGLSGREQATARKRLRELGILDERRGLQSLMWFRVPEPPLRKLLIERKAAVGSREHRPVFTKSANDITSCALPPINQHPLKTLTNAPNAVVKCALPPINGKKRQMRQTQLWLLQVRETHLYSRQLRMSHIQRLQQRLHHHPKPLLQFACVPCVVAKCRKRPTEAKTWRRRPADKGFPDPPQPL